MSRLRTGPGNPESELVGQLVKVVRHPEGYNNMAPNPKKKLGKLELASSYPASANDVSSVVNFSRFRLRRSKGLMKTSELIHTRFDNLDDFFVFYFTSRSILLYTY